MTDFSLNESSISVLKQVVLKTYFQGKTDGLMLALEHIQQLPEKNAHLEYLTSVIKALIEGYSSKGE